MTAPAPARPRGSIRRLAGQCLRHPFAAALVAVSSLLIIALGAVGPLVARAVVDDAVAGRGAATGVVLGVLLGLAALRFAGSFLSQYATETLALGVQHDLRREVFESVQRLDGVRQDGLRTGQVVSRAIVDLQAVQRFLTEATAIAGALAMGVFALGAMAFLSAPLTLVAVLVFALMAVVTLRTGRVLLPATWSARERASDIVQHVAERVAGIRVVTGFGQESREVGRFRGLALRLFAEQLRVATLRARSVVLLAGLPGLAQVALLGLGGWLVMNGTLSLGTFLAFSSYCASLAGPAGALGQLVLTVQTGRVAADRIYEIVDANPVVVEAADPRDLPEGPLAVRLERVSFGYSRQEPVLRDVTLTVEPGETLAIVGATGSGKSTLSLLLPRFYDVHAGSVGLGPPGAETDVRQLRLRDLRSAVGIVFEEPFLFSDTIRANIAYGLPGATDAAVEAAARKAAAHDFVAALPHGYDTVVGDRGITLSGGQRQRVALARALLSEPRVLVMDDATSALDNRTEAAVHAALRDVTGERTTLLIARRRSTLALADRIAVLDRGRVVDVGTRRELEARCPLFTSLLAGPGEELGRSSGAPVTTAEPFRGNGGVPGARRGGEVAGGGFTPGLWPAEEAGAGPGPDTGVGGAPPWAVSLPPADAEPRLPPGLDVEAPDGEPGVGGVVGPVRRPLAVGAALMVLGGLASIALPTLIRHGVDQGVSTGSAPVLWAASGVALLAVLVSSLSVAGQTVVTARAGETVLYLLRVRSFAHLQRLGLDYHEHQRAGQIMTRMTSDVEALSAFVTTGLATALVETLTLLGVAVTLVLADPSLALVAFAVLPPLVMAVLVYRRFSAAAYAEARERDGAVNAELQEGVSGLRVAQAHGAEERSARRFSQRSDAYRRSRLRAGRHLALFSPTVALLFDVAYAAVLAAGSLRVADGEMTVGVLLAFLLYLTRLFSPVQQLSTALDSYQQASVGMRRVAELLRTRPSVAAPERPVRVPARLRGEIELSHVTFRYPGSRRPALRDVSLRIEAGETVAVVGATGAGKSTLVKLIARFYDPEEGRVLVDGVDLRRYPPSRYRRRLGVVPQEPSLFTGDLASNIAYPRPDAGPAEIEEAARRVDALALAASLPLGFRQPVGEHGRGLSAGQQQLVALARAELADPDILLLDEATAALDPLAEAAVLAARERLTRRRTTVVVAHRLATAARADRVLVLHGGRIVEDGGHEHLLAMGGRYARLWSAG
ncbi:ABC transporter ATP-binding protein [Streptosporangium carneum]|uniref:ABC transporter n=1 Tax=Streptosporangium carneum TaxID=47481 RepID=A0A9W6IBJ7_9ACTN|nr:ABC transporter ATP-binding protein [Streptosporangium carneum]GLK14465.1 ABC transporter [Streptosporangium carneum]